MVKPFAPKDCTVKKNDNYKEIEHANKESCQKNSYSTINANFNNEKDNAQELLK